MWIWPFTILYLFDTWWNMLIKFSKQIRNSSAKIDTKVSSKPRQTSEMELFLQVASEATSESCQTFMMEIFVKIVKNEKPFTIFAKSSILDVWQGSEYTSEFVLKVKALLFLKSIWISKVTDNLLLGKNKKSQPIFKIVEHVFKQNLIHKFWNLKLRNKTLANITEIFENAFHIDLHFT